MLKDRHVIQSAFFLIVAAIVLCVAADFEYISEETEGAKSVEWRVSPFFEHMEIYESTKGAFPKEIAISITPLSKITYLQIGGSASRAEYVPLLGMIFVNEYSVDDDGTRMLIGSETISREEANSDYYSPLLHRDGGTSSFGVFSHFGTYSIR